MGTLKTIQFAECPRCYGRGVVTYPYDNQHELHDCAACSGRGVLRVYPMESSSGGRGFVEFIGMIIGVLVALAVFRACS